jgi:transposase InsO family protein
MKENEKALQRFAAINHIQQLHAQGFSLERCYLLASEQSWAGKYYSQRSLERWHRAHKQGGFKALVPKKREDRGRSRALDEELKDQIVALRRQYPQLTVKSLLAELYRREILIPGAPPSASSIYRFLREVSLDKRSLHAGVLSGPTKAFEHAFANELWMTDAMHGITLKTDQGKVIKTHLIALIDDCSRFIPHAQYYEKETTQCLLDVLKQAVMRRGIPEKLYTDRGKIFTCKHVQQVCGNLPTQLLHAKPYHSWSKGKIERFFLTLQKSFEQALVFDKVTSLEELNSRLWKWIEQHYHQREHSCLSGESPAERYRRRSEKIRLYRGDPEALKRLFYKEITRRVRKDATISIEGSLWEVATHLRGAEVQVRYDPFVENKQLEIYQNGKVAGSATPCDKNYNARHFKSSNYER